MSVNNIFKNKEAQKKEGLVNAINDLMAISCNRLYVFFDLSLPFSKSKYALLTRRCERRLQRPYPHLELQGNQ